MGSKSKSVLPEGGAKVVKSVFAMWVSMAILWLTIGLWLYIAGVYHINASGTFMEPILAGWTGKFIAFCLIVFLYIIEDYIDD